MPEYREQNLYEVRYMDVDFDKCHFFYTYAKSEDGALKQAQANHSLPIVEAVLYVVCENVREDYRSQLLELLRGAA